MRCLLSRTLGVIVVSGALMSPSVAAAGTITFDNITATWSDVQGGTNVDFTNNGTGNASVMWGVPSGGGQSGYNFLGPGGPVNAALPPSPTPDFIIGTFTHFNQPISSGSSISGLRLTINTDVALDAVPLGNYSFVYDIVHNETPNGADPCADGGAHGVGVNVNGCADNVQTNYNLLSDSFQIGLDLYTLDIRGFELLVPPNTKVLSFWTTEQLDNEAYLLARAALTSEVTGQQVPEPASLTLLSAGLAAAGLLRRRRRA
jgi:hypothetical protein